MGLAVLAAPFHKAQGYEPEVPRQRGIGLHPVEPGARDVDRTGRTFDDFSALPLEDRARVVQGDSVEGFEGNRQDLLSLFVPLVALHICISKRRARKEDTVACLDGIERACGYPEAFEAAIPVLLVDRGREFDDWEGMERFCLAPGFRSGTQRNRETRKKVFAKSVTTFL